METKVIETGDKIDKNEAVGGNVIDCVSYSKCEDNNALTDSQKINEDSTSSSEEPLYPVVFIKNGARKEVMLTEREILQIKAVLNALVREKY